MPLPNGTNYKSGDEVELIEGEIYSLCSCGKSKILPFCDSSHKELAPDFKSIKFKVERGGKVVIY